MPSDRHREGGTHVAERHVGDLPLAVPQQRRLRLVRGLAVEADDRLRQVSPVVRVDALADLEHAVDRRLERAGEIRRDHVGETAVAAEDGRRAQLLRDVHDVAELDHGLAAGQRVGRHRRGGEELGPGQVALGQATRKSRSDCGPRRDANSRPTRRRAAPGSCRRRRSARPRRIRGDPGRWKSAGAAAAA